MTRLFRWLRKRLFGTQELGISKVRYVETHTAIRRLIEDDCMVVVGTPLYPKWGVFMCPCRRGHRIELNLQRHLEPHWQLSVRGSRPTVQPSVDHQGAYRCHFRLIDGLVRWVED